MAGGTDKDDERFYCGHEKATLFNTGEEGLTAAEAQRRLVRFQGRGLYLLALSPSLNQAHAPQETFGKNQLPEKEDNKLLKLASEFVQPMPLMIWAAIFIEVRSERRRAISPLAAVCASGDEC